MEFKNIYLVRHGSIEMNDNRKYFIGQIDLAMNTEGEEQAIRLGEKLKKIKISSVYCSDLMRSVKTAGKISVHHGVSPVIRPELREISLGDWDGLTFSEVKNLYPDEFKKRGMDIINYRPAGGESFRDCSKRVIPAFEKIVKESKGNIVIAGHAGVNRLILCHVIGIPFEKLFNISQDYGCLNIIFAGTDNFRVTLINDTGSI